MSARRAPEWWRAAGVAAAGNPARGFAGRAAEREESVLPFCALLGFTFILLLAPQKFFPPLEPLRIALLTGGLGIAAHLFDRFVHRRPLTVLAPEMWIASGLVGWALLTLPFSYWPGGSVSLLRDLYLKTLAIFWLLSNAVDTPARLRRVAWALSLLAVPVATVAAKAYLSGAFMEGVAVKRIVGYEAPLTENPNDLALMLNLILPLTVALYVINRSRIVRTALVGMIFLDIVAVVLTFSRAGFVTLAATVAAYLWKLVQWPHGGRAGAAAMLALLVLAVPFLPSGYLNRVGTITDFESDPTGSAQERWNDTVAAVRFVLKNPIVGAGIGVEDLALNEERGPLWRVPHNVYLQHAVGLGVPGLALFLLLLAGCFKSARLAQRRAASRPGSRDLFWLATGVEVSLVGFTVGAVFYPVAYHFYFYYVAGLAVAAKMISEVQLAPAEDATVSGREGGIPHGRQHG